MHGEEKLSLFFRSLVYRERERERERRERYGGRRKKKDASRRRRARENVEHTRAQYNVICMHAARERESARTGLLFFLSFVLCRKTRAGNIAREKELDGEEEDSKRAFFNRWAQKKK